MPRGRKKVEVADPVETQINKDIGELIYYTYTTYKNSKPDATVYKSNYKMLEQLFRGNEHTRVYTLSELKKVIDYLAQSDIAITSFSILFWPDLVRAIVDEDKQATRYSIERLKGSQRSQGFYGLKTLNADPPPGW